MQRLLLQIMPRGEKPVRLEAPDVNSALAIIDINMGAGEAEIWDGDKLLARMTRSSNNAQPVWEIG